MLDDRQHIEDIHFQGVIVADHDNVNFDKRDRNQEQCPEEEEEEKNEEEQPVPNTISRSIKASRFKSATYVDELDRDITNQTFPKSRSIQTSGHSEFTIPTTSSSYPASSTIIGQQNQIFRQRTVKQMAKTTSQTRTRGKMAAIATVPGDRKTQEYTQGSGPSTIPLDFTPQGDRLNLSTAEREHSISYYEQVEYQAPRTTRSSEIFYPSTAPAQSQEDVGEPETQGQDSTERTQSTALTIAHGQTGFVDFTGCLPESNEPGEPKLRMAPVMDEESQEPSYLDTPAMRSFYATQYQPQTPAAVTNPFAHRGSVMQGAEMFGMTQPSAMGTHFAGPTPSLPSPNLHGPMSSPQKMVRSSPLQRFATRHDEVQEQPTSPIEPSPRPSTSPSRDDFTSDAAWKPRTEYVPMHESQERRLQPGSDSEDGQDSFVFDQNHRKQRVQRARKRAERELSEVIAVSVRSLQHGTKMKSRESSRLSYSSPTRVQQRTSSQLYSAVVESHSNGGTNRDGAAGRVRTPSRSMDSDEVIQDSQNAPLSPVRIAASASDADDMDFTAESEQTHELEREHDGSSMPVGDVFQNEDQDAQSSRQSQQVTAGPLSTPIHGAIIPETSPADHHLIPLGTLASFSCTSQAHEDMPPGFTPDPDYAEAMGLQQEGLYIGTSMVALSETREQDDSTPAPKNGESGWVLPEAQTASSEPSIAAKGISRISRVPRQLHRITTSNDTKAVSQDEGRLSEGLDSKENTPRANPRELRPKAVLKGISRNLRRPASPDQQDTSAQTPVVSPKGQAARSMRSDRTPTTTTTRASRLSDDSNVSSRASTPLSSAPSTLLTPSDEPAENVIRSLDIDPSPLAKRGHSSRRKTSKDPAQVSSIVVITRRSTRLSTEDSEDPIQMQISPAPVPSAGHAVQEESLLFKDMLFAISYAGSAKEKEKIEVTQLITRLGGRIEDASFEDLFKSNAEGRLVPTPAARKLAFVAVIADEYSRKPKYMQALALGIPCLSSRWVADCAQSGRRLDWQPYLLSAGFSTHLDAVRSRSVGVSGSSSSLLAMFEARPCPLHGHSLTVVKSKSRSREGNPYNFLIRAMEPDAITPPLPVEQARQHLLDGCQGAGAAQSQLVFIEKNDKYSHHALLAANTTASSAGGKKRKRGSVAIEAHAKASPVLDGVRIISEETIIQSLILGVLVPDF